MEIPYVKVISALVATGSLIGILYQGFQLMDERHVLRAEIEAEIAARLELSRTLQLRDNINWLEGKKNIIQYDVNRITDILEMYQTRELLNGDLDPADRNRVQGLTIDMNKALLELSGVEEAIDAMRLAVQP